MLLALNRDEFFDRPAAAMKFIEDKEVYAGVDQRFGGTWFAVDKKGNFAFVTNIRNKALGMEGRPTRGELPFLALEGEADFLDNAGKYNPFNLVWGNVQKINYFNNIEGVEKELKDSLLSVSNCAAPCYWPKAVEGKKLFEKIDLEWDDERIFSEAFLAMQTNEHYDFVAPDTGFEEEDEKALTPIFIRQKNYGTVSTTVMLIGEDGIRIDERKWPDGKDTKFTLRKH